MAEGARTMIEKLNNKNYQVWKYKLELLLIKEDLWDVVHGTTNETNAGWMKKDGKARATIGLLVEDGQLAHIRKCTTAKEVWESLRKYHERSTLTNKVFMLKRLCNMKLTDTGDMENHIDAMMDISERLVALGEELPEHLLVAFLLCSLPESYSTLITALETRPESDLTLELVKGRLIHEDRRRKESHDTKKEGNTALRTVNVFDSKLPNKDGATNDRPADERVQKGCFYCKKLGHFKRECRKLAADRKKGYQRTRYNANAVTDEKPHSDEHYCFGAINATHKLGWYVDSGATCHMSNNKDFFIDFDDSIKEDIYMANGNCVQASGKGNGYLNCMDELNKTNKVMVKNVLFVPDLETSLLSVCRLTAEGLSIIFQGTRCNITKNNTIIATAEQKGQLYELNCKQQALNISTGHSHECIHLWHRRLGHRDPEAIKTLVKHKMAEGINLTSCQQIVTCTDCIKGKMTRTSFPKKSTSKTTKQLDLIHTDICGPMQTPTPSGKRYFLTLIDDFSRYTIVYLLAKKSEAAERIFEYIQLISTQFHRKPKVLRSDGGGEYLGNEIKHRLANEGIVQQITAPYSPQQNGTAERKNRSLCEMTRCMLKDAGLHNKYWGEAIMTANYLQNRLPTKACDRTPFELWTSKKPDMQNIRIFGAEAYMHIPTEKRQKLDDKATKYTMVGYQEGSKAYRLLDTNTDRVHISRDVRFLESPQHYKINTDSGCTQVMIPEPNVNDMDLNTLSVILPKSADIHKDESYQDLALRRSQRSNKGKLPARYAHAVTIYEPEEPRSLREAVMSPHHHEWGKAMDEEMKSLCENHAWELVKLPPGKNVVDSKWTFKIKTDAQGNVNRYKARLVARGFSQKYGEEYDQIFAPVIKQTTLRTMLAIAGKHRMHVRHFDVKTAFLNGDLTEDVYMKQPEGYEKKGSEELVCHLKKSIYGLKQSARSWNLKLNDILLDNGFERGNADQCLYQKSINQDCIYLLIYVDDLIMISTNEELIEQTGLSLGRHFEISDLGALSYYLGIQVHRDDDGIFHLNQPTYINKLLKRFGLEEAKPSSIPMDPGYFKIKTNESQLPSNETYRQAIGALLYIATNTRPDITVCTSILSRKIAAPTQADWTEVKRVLRYLKGTSHIKLSLGNRETSSLELHGYVDADWAGDTTDRKSNSGYIFKYLGGAICWGSRKQTCVALSSTEAEYIALSDASREIKWLRELLTDLHLKPKDATVIFEDNQGCLKLLDSERTNPRTKHIDIRYHFVRELQRNLEIDVQYCPTEEMVADILTKPVTSTRLKRMVKIIGLN